MSGFARAVVPWVPAATLLALSLVGGAWLQFQPRTEAGPAAGRAEAFGGRSLAAIFPPWWSAEESLLAAAGSGAALVREGALSSIVVLAQTSPSTPQRLRAAGALLVIDPVALGGCLSGSGL